MITTTYITAGGQANSGLSSFTTASITPSAIKLYVLCVESWLNSGSVNEPTVTGAGLTWTKITTVLSGTNQRLTFFRALGSGSAGALTIDHAGQVQILCNWALYEFTDVKNTVGGADAIVQAATNNNSGTTTGMTVTLGAFNSINNATFGFLTHEAGALAITAGSGFTALSVGSWSSHTGHGEFKDTNDTTVEWTWSSQSGQHVAIAIEIAAAVVGGASAFAFL